jgi:hypothetical protein
MTDPDLPYNRSLHDLESLLARVERPGDFHVHGALALPMPMVHVDGVGPLSFPLLEVQAAALIAAAERAPYGRGEQTVLDPSVRRVWQIDAARVRLGGKSWSQSLRRVLADAARGLGCEDAAIRAELYKLLVYDPGGFFLPHRDSEKSPGMFGTLLIQLPSPHTGGELRVRHGSREARIDLSATDGSELAFAAFYADCEHEVRPVESGHRLCLVFNLLRGAAGDAPPASAPSYEPEVAQAARLIGAAFAAEDAPCKLAWLLGHHYSQAELAFDALKGADAAVVGVLRRAVDVAACGVHLAVMHIEESGPAEVHYAPRPGRRYRDDFDDDGEIDAAAAGYEVIEVSDAERYIDHWIGADGHAPTFGRLPLADGELLPAGALDDEPPDEERLLEATGNEGVSFERAYRRAVLVLWPRARQVEVLLQGGVGSALPALEAMLSAQGPSAGALDVAERIVAYWSRQGRPRYTAGREGPLRVRMLRCLARFGPTTAGERFMHNVLVADYDGSENTAVAEAAPLMLAGQALGRLLGALVETRFLRCPRALCELLFLLESASASQRSPDHGAALRRSAQALVAALPGLAGRPPRDEFDWGLAYDGTAADAESCNRLLSVLERLGAGQDRAAAVTALIAEPRVFDPGRVLVPALQSMCAAAPGGGVAGDAQRLRLWRHCCAFLLARSEVPPPAPRDWRQPVTLSCRCEDCRALQAFALDPRLREQRFRVRQDRRQHLHRQIEQHGLDMSHVTERRGSPQTLVCSKTRESYRRQCRQHAEDVAGMRALQALADAALAAECAPLAAAAAREPEALEG